MFDLRSADVACKQDEAVETTRSLSGSITAVRSPPTYANCVTFPFGSVDVRTCPAGL